MVQDGESNRGAAAAKQFWTATLPAAILVLGGVAFRWIFAWAGKDRALSGLNDFLPFYAGGKLAFTGHLYDQAQVLAEEHKASGVFGENLYFIRPPWFAALLWLRALPF